MSELKLQQSRLDGRYDIVECLGRGSYAEIYVANDNAARNDQPRTVVIKALNMFLQDAPDPELERTLITNFQNEAVALDRVRHPNVINRLGHGTAIDLAGTTFHYLVIEYLPGGDLAALTRNKPLPLQKALSYLEQVSSGLAHAHKCGVIHRDIKPQNLLLTADEMTVKIADFGVARIDAGEGVITRVGTNIYAAPEHNPLVHTGQLATSSLIVSREHLTPAADIYSLAKTAYTLLAGESPRRFAQHRITDLPEALKNTFWADPVLRVLEKATQTQASDRYQTVEEFWDALAEASLPPTRPLGIATQDVEQQRRPSEDLIVDVDDFTQPAPPRPQFASVAVEKGGVETSKRPRIVVAINSEAERYLEQREYQFDRPPGNKPPGRRQPTNGGNSAFVPASKGKRAIVALGLIMAFSGMLLATHKYVTSHWNPLSVVPQIGELVVVGKEGFTTTDVNLRPDANTTNAPIGLAESGSKVKVLSADSNWYEVQVEEHGRPKSDPYSADRGWINKKFVRFD